MGTWHYSKPWAFLCLLCSDGVILRKLKAKAKAVWVSVLLQWKNTSAVRSCSNPDVSTGRTNSTSLHCLSLRGEECSACQVQERFQWSVVRYKERPYMFRMNQIGRRLEAPLAFTIHWFSIRTSADIFHEKKGRSSEYLSANNKETDRERLSLWEL
jgi:hypothetical protein